ncbi:MAG TPA: carboxypeptidase regulatory-like domain-containing protein [Pyrinomonadaceae bacterium]|nr:carboxypeptidase regulatory-like domain-containing protein [Pyrinomonadaceae bacterium]
MLSTTRFWLANLFVALAMLMFATVTSAQTITGSISGAVTDSNGGVIPGAIVTLVGEKTGQARTVTTDSEGRFTFAALQPGKFILKVERQGFQTSEQRDVVLSANEKLALPDMKLQPGQVSETVSVTSEGTIVERESSDLTARLTADQINLISTKGRDVTSLLRLLPGTSNNDDIEGAGDGFGTDLPNVSGQRGRSTVPTIDGLFAGEPSGSNKLSFTINQDAVAEVKVLRNNYGAEYGNNGGAIINIVSKGGGKEYAGSAYYFLRNESLNGTPFFNNKAGLARPLYRHLYPGGNFGGPLPLPKFGEGGKFWLKDKAFFFFSYEKPHQITPNDPRFVTMPTALERQGDFSQSINSSNAKVFVRDPLNPGTGCSASDTSGCFKDPSRATTSNPLGLNIIPQARWNASGVALLNYFPLPNTLGGSGGSAFNYVFQSPTDVPKRSRVIRFDVRPTNADTIYWKYQWWTSDNLGTGTSGWPGNDNNRWGINSHYLYKDDGWSANWVRVINSSVVNEFNFGMRHDSEGFIPGDGEIERLQRSALNYTAPQLFPQNNHLGTIPRVTNWGGVRAPTNGIANINWLDRWGEVGNDYIKPSFADNLSITHGNHAFKFGMYYERLLNGEAPGGQWSGVFNFAGNDTNFTTALGNTGYAYANALIGNFRNYQETTARPFTNLRLTQVQWYGVDQWRINRRFTLNYGVRFGYHSPFEQIDGQGSNFDPRLFDPTKTVALYESACAVAFTPPATCPTASRRAKDPTTGQLFVLTGPTAGLVGAIVPNTGNPNNGLAIGTDPNTPPGYRITRKIDIEPRLGLAWDIGGSGKTVLRFQGGVYHAPRVGGGTTGGNLVNNQPANRTFSIDYGNINNLAALTGTALTRPSSLNAVEVNSHTPTIYNFTFGVQRDIGFKTVLEASYVGSFARHLGQRININDIPDGAKLGTNNIDPVTGSRRGDEFLRPYRGYGDINMVAWGGTSNYNSLQVQVNRRYTRGFQAGLAYTYSKSFDYANDDSSDISFGRPYKAFNYAPSDFDQTHIFTVNYIYDVPSISSHMNHNKFVGAILDNWQISGTTSYASGKPKNVTVTYTGGSAGTVTISLGQPCPVGSSIGTTTATTQTCVPITDFTGGGINARMNMVCDPMKGDFGTDPTGTPRSFNVSCFAKPTALGDIGNQPRNNVRMPSIFNNDLAFFKNIKVGEKHSVQLRWEIYNIFNHTNFRDIDAGAVWGMVVNNPGGTANCSLSNVCTASFQQTNTRFGAVTSARTPRVMQASIRFNF